MPCESVPIWPELAKIALPPVLDKVPEFLIEMSPPGAIVPLLPDDVSPERALMASPKVVDTVPELLMLIVPPALSVHCGLEFQRRNFWRSIK